MSILKLLFVFYLSLTKLKPLKIALEHHIRYTISLKGKSYLYFVT